MQINDLVRLKKQPDPADFWACVARVLMPVESIDVERLTKLIGEDGRVNIAVTPILTEIKILGRSWYVASSLYWTTVIGLRNRP